MKKIAMLSGLIIMSMSVFGADRPSNVKRVTETRVFARESKELIQAINKDDVKKVRQIISRHTDISKMVGFLTLIKQAKKKGASDEELKEINERYQNDIPDDMKLLVNTAYGYDTPLLRAIEKGNLEIVKLLIDCGADVNALVKNRNVDIESERYVGGSITVRL